MVETMRREGHTALVHTAAASNLGQMLNRLCLAGRRAAREHRAQRRAGEAPARLGADARRATRASPTFIDDLTEALAETGATLAFDAIGGGTLAGQILRRMEAAAQRRRGRVQPLRLDDAQAGLHLRRPRPWPTELDRELRHGVGRRRLAAHARSWPRRVPTCSPQHAPAAWRTGLTTTFASHYTDELTLADALSLDAVQRYGRPTTGRKFVITPHA